MRSHTLRAEAEEEFKSLCLEFPQFGYDVLSKLFYVLMREGVRWLCWGWLLTCVLYSTRTGREAQAREEREDASRCGQRTEEGKAQPGLGWSIGGVVGMVMRCAPLTLDKRGCRPCRRWRRVGCPTLAGRIC